MKKTLKTKANKKSLYLNKKEKKRKCVDEFQFILLTMVVLVVDMAATEVAMVAMADIVDMVAGNQKQLII